MLIPLLLTPPLQHRAVVLLWLIALLGLCYLCKSLQPGGKTRIPVWISAGAIRWIFSGGWKFSYSPDCRLISGAACPLYILRTIYGICLQGETIRFTLEIDKTETKALVCILSIINDIIVLNHFFLFLLFLVFYFLLENNLKKLTLRWFMYFVIF